MPLPAIVAHRGLHHTFPENSLQAFTAAWEAGVEWCECDIHSTRDGAPIVFHDDTLDRMTTGSGPVVRLGLQELLRLRLRTADGEPTDFKIPTLTEVLAAMPVGCGLIIEFKEILQSGEADDLWGQTGNHRVMYQSFHAQNLPLLAKAIPSSGFAWLLDTQAAIEAAIASSWPALHVNHRHLGHRHAKRIRDSGKSLGVWTVNEEADLRRVIGLSPKTIITDEPLRAQAIVNEAESA